MAVIKCPKCGERIENVSAGVVTCPKCGGKMRYTPKNQPPSQTQNATPESKAKGNTQKCKHCKSNIPVGAKVCPHCRKKQKGGGCLKWTLIVFSIFILIGIGISALLNETLNKSGTENKNAKSQKSGEKEFQVGETWMVDGQWNLTINSVEETQDRNQFEEKQPAAVYKITYTYENIGYEDKNEIMDGLYLPITNTIVDNGGKMGYEYPLVMDKNAEQTPVGATCEAQVCVGVDNAGSFKLHVVEYDGNGEKHSAVFNIEL